MLFSLQLRLLENMASKVEVKLFRQALQLPSSGRLCNCWDILKHCIEQVVAELDLLMMIGRSEDHWYKEIQLDTYFNNFVLCKDKMEGNYCNDFIIPPASFLSVSLLCSKSELIMKQRSYGRIP